MLTQEQIYTLGIGDEIIVHGKCEDIYPDGDIRVSSYWTVAGEKREQSFLVHSSCVSLPTDSQSSTVNKYDPCRLFRKGDIVRLKEWNGRCPALPEDWKFDNELFKVHEDEKFNSSVEITREKSKTVYIAPICFLELVTPVEEMEPYKLIDSPNTYNIVRDSATVMTIYKKSHPNAKAAADAECARLNEEWRKEQNND